MVARTSADFVRAYYLMATAVLSFVAVLGLSETGGGMPDDGNRRMVRS